MDFRFTELLRRMVATPSTTFNEAEVRDIICSFLGSEGVEYSCVKNNILAMNRHWDSAKPTLMLCAHMDTVAPAADYSFDPFQPDYGLAGSIIGADEPFIAGLGSNDDGGSVVCMIAAFLRFYNRKDLGINIMLVISAEEEKSGPDGTRYLWGEYWAGEDASGAAPDKAPDKASGRFPRPDMAIIGEPTSGRAATSERGLLVLDAIAEGVSGHAAREEGVNALYIALEDIQKLRGFNFSKVSPVMGRVKLSVTQIQAGSAHNVIPDRCSFVVDIRPTECYTNTEILEMLQAECRSCLTARNLTNRSSATSADGVLMKTIAALGFETFSSPTTSDWMRTRCDAVKLGPGNSGRSHHSDEYILESEMDDALEKYTRIIESLGK